eukprot:4984229-Ditylum_brightwellii.AAC.1
MFHLLDQSGDQGHPDHLAKGGSKAQSMAWHCSWHGAGHYWWHSTEHDSRHSLGHSAWHCGWPGTGQDSWHGAGCTVAKHDMALDTDNGMTEREYHHYSTASQCLKMKDPEVRYSSDMIGRQWAQLTACSWASLLGTSHGMVLVIIGGTALGIMTIRHNMVLGITKGVVLCTHHCTVLSIVAGLALGRIHGMSIVLSTKDSVLLVLPDGIWLGALNGGANGVTNGTALGSIRGTWMGIINYMGHSSDCDVVTDANTFANYTIADFNAVDAIWDVFPLDPLPTCWMGQS